MAKTLFSTLVVLLTLLFSLWLGAEFGLKWAIMALIGFALGFTLAFSRFGIVTGWREMIVSRNSYYVRIHLITIAIEVVLFSLCLSYGHAIFGGKMVGNIMPVGIPFVAGAFIFGIGMQIAGACASGTLYCCGEGRPRFWIVLLFFGIGTLFGQQLRPTVDSHFHSQVILLADLTGSRYGGIVFNLAIILCLYLLFHYLELRKTGKVAPILKGSQLFWNKGRFTVLTGGIAIALLNSAVLAVHGSAWTITGAINHMALHGAALLPGFSGTATKVLSPLFANPMVGMFWAGILGAAFSRCICGRQNVTPVTVRNCAAAAAGGTLMGVSAMYAACNLGGFFDGTASGSVHGWIWMLMALCGSTIGIRLRSWFY